MSTIKAVEPHWNNFRRIKKSRKNHIDACTGLIIPVGSSCWKFVGKYYGDFTSWYCSNETKDFINKMQYQDWECSEIGDMIKERNATI